MRQSFLLVVACACALDADAENATPADAEKAPNTAETSSRQSTLAPLVKYLDVWRNMHATDAGVPKLVFLLDDEALGEAEAPSWFSTAAMRYKDGKKKTAAFFAVKAGKDASHAATRFGLSNIPAGGALFACVPDGSGGGYTKRFDSPLASGGGGERTRAVRAFVDAVLAGVPEDEREPLPAFPEPTRPRKAAAVRLEEFTHESLPLRCYGVQAKPLCIVAILPGAAGAGCPEALSGLAKRHANDPISFGCVGGAKQHDFLSAYGLDDAALPALVAVKAGRRARFARLDGPLEAQLMNGFVDNILGGGASFTRVEELPELEAPYLLEKDEM